jgi:tetratricopeptide (TPR) repeat protein
MTTTTAPRTPSRMPVHRPRVVGVLIAAVALAAISYVTSAARPAASPSRPASAAADAAAPAEIGIPGSAVAQPAVGSLDQIDHSIAAWTQNLAANPKDYLSADNLATLYHGRGRLTADLADQERALEATRTVLRIVPSDPSARILEASIQFTIHDFEGAFATASALYAKDPTQLAALATKADAELELGRIDAATADYHALAAATSGAGVDVRLARLAYVTGDPAAAVARSEAALAQATTAGEDTGFYDYAVAEYARFAGDAGAARVGYEAALKVRSTDLASLVGLARIDAFDGRTGAAIAGLQRAAAIAPQPETLALLGDLLASRGDTAAANDQFATVRLTGRLSALAGTVYDRQLIGFELDHGGATEATLAAARASLAARPDAAGHDLVAWALHRLGRDDAAVAESDAARATGIVDARIVFHAGAIALGRGDADGGRALLRQALALGPALDPAARAEASSLLAR